MRGIEPRPDRCHQLVVVSLLHERALPRWNPDGRRVSSARLLLPRGGLHREEVMRIALALLLTAYASFPPNAEAATERVNVCVQQISGMGFGGKKYEVEATVADGADLNQATGSFRFQVLSKYVVIFWGPGQASILRLSSPFLTFIFQPASDQYEREWRVAESTGICI